MKKILLICILVLMLCGCGSKKYIGYWCRYDETATIVVLLNKDVSASDKSAIEEKISSFDNITSSNYYSREDYAKELGEDVEGLDIYDNYVITFNSMDYIGTYVSELSEMSGVHEAKQVHAKDHISLYNLEKGGKYTYTDSDEANEEDIITGKYKVKKGVIVFSPSRVNADDVLLYTKDGHLCEDADCTKIYFKSDKNCSAE